MMILLNDTICLFNFLMSVKHPSNTVHSKGDYFYHNGFNYL